MTLRRLVRSLAVLTTTLGTVVVAAGPSPAGADSTGADSTDAADAAPRGEEAWEQVPAPPLDGQVSLNGVTATGPRDAWAVGTISDGVTVHTLTLHWDGTAWTRVPSPNRTDESWLFSVDASGPDDAWAVGYDVDDANRHRTLVLHWDGEAWSEVPSPDPGAEGSQLMDVAAVLPGEAWAVGSSTVAFPLLGETLALRWDGSTWTRVPSPNPSTVGVGSNLQSVDVAPDGTAWSVGAVDQGDLVMGSMAMRWVHGAWQLVDVPSNPAGSLAGAVQAGGRDRAWVVGWQQGEAGLEALALARRGGRWVETPVDVGAGAGEVALADVAWSRGRAWAVGSQGTDALSVRWNGRRWVAVPVANPGTVATSFVDMAAVPRSGCLWAVGQYTDGDRGQALVERHCP
jgi:hypothetical protein